ncbi:MAG: hypothetical protein QXT73_00600 [Candidatus Methanomethylicaceae archaeon]
MAELLVQVKYKADTDLSNPEHIKGRFHPGDVIVVRDDGWSWGTGELNSENTTIIKLPGVSREELEAILYQPYQVEHGTEYHARCPELGLSVTAPTKEIAEAELQKRVNRTIQELEKLGYSNISYTTRTEERPVIEQLLQRKVKLDIELLKQVNLDAVENKAEALLGVVVSKDQVALQEPGLDAY